MSVPASPSGDLHSGRTNDSSLQFVAGAENVADVRLTVPTIGLEEGLVELGVERLPLGIDSLQALGLEDVGKLRVHDLHPANKLVEVRLLLGRHEGKLELIENFQQPHDQRFGGELDRTGLLPEPALAEVVELRLQ